MLCDEERGVGRWSKTRVLSQNRTISQLVPPRGRCCCLYCHLRSVPFRSVPFVLIVTIAAAHYTIDHSGYCYCRRLGKQSCCCCFCSRRNRKVVSCLAIYNGQQQRWMLTLFWSCVLNSASLFDSSSSAVDGASLRASTKGERIAREASYSV